MFDLKTIASAYGGRVSPSGDTAQIPAPGHSKRDRSVSLRRTGDGKLLIHCFSDTDWRDVRSELLNRGFAREEDFPSRASKRTVVRHRRQAPKKARNKTAHTDTFERAKHLWTERLPIKGSLAELYLKSRGLSQMSGSSALGFYPSAQISAPGAPVRTAPVLLAEISAPGGGFMGLQLTVLSKSSARKRFRLVFGPQMEGAVRLEPLQSCTLLIAEGLETAASASKLFDVPAWSLLNTANFAVFDPPQEVKRLIIAADRDRPGLKAAESLLERLKERQLLVETVAPLIEGEDWNDVLKRANLSAHVNT